MALAQSPADNTPLIIHGVFSHTSAEKAYDKMIKAGRIPERIQEVRHIQVIPTCPTPKDPNKLRDLTIELIYFDETSAVDEVSNLRCGTNLDEEDIMSSNSFGSDKLRDDVDATVVMGNPCKEKGNLPQKLLCHRFSSMISNYLPLEVKNKIAEDI